jgi:peptidyl-prolyl cis-trans isomerase C
LALFCVIALSLIFLTACKQGSLTAPGTTAEVRLTETATGSPQPSQTPVPPTSTPVPLAALVNGEAISLDEYQAELSRFQVSVTITGTNLASEASTVVLNELIDQTLLAQSAAENGYSVDDTVLQSRIEALTTELSGSQTLEDWKTLYGYSDEDFQKALRRAVGAAWMRDQIIAAVPETADQVHVMQILLPTAAVAQQAYSELQSGVDFQELAAEYDPDTGGDLGWFPRGYLNEPVIDEAVFALQPNQYSQVVETEIGFHIFYLAERDPNHPLLPDARYALQARAVADWLDEKRSQSEIQILLP